MPKRKRSKQQPGPAGGAHVVSAQERAAELFIDSVKAHDAADRAERERERAETERAARLVELRSAKQTAADRIKQLRASSGKGQEVIEAEADYRLALAALQELETGERPHWAPPLDQDDGTDDVGQPPSEDLPPDV